MTELSLGVPGEENVAEALECIREIRWMGEIGEVRLAPYVSGLLAQLEGILAVTPITPRHPVVPAPAGSCGDGKARESR